MVGEGEELNIWDSAKYFFWFMAGKGSLAGFPVLTSEKHENWETKQWGMSSLAIIQSRWGPIACANTQIKTQINAQMKIYG